MKDDRGTGWPGYTKLTEVEYFKKRVRIGEELNCMIFKGDIDSKDAEEEPATCQLLAKGKHTAKTTKGTMQWTLLAVWNKEKILKWKEMDRAYKREGRRKHEDGLHLLTL